MMPYKRPAADKSGMPVYQPSATTYQQLMQLQQQPFVPVSCEYTSPPPIPTSIQNQSTQQTQNQQPQVALNSSVSCASPAVAATAPTAVSVAAVASTHTSESTKTSPELSVVNTVTHHHHHQVTEPEPSLPTTNPIQPPPLPPAALDAAAIAKEVAQQNYAKAVKLAAVSQSYGLNSALTALNYTGVALNKQPVTIPAPAMPRYPTLPFAFTGTTPTPGLNLTSLNPNPFTHQTAQLSQPNLFSFTRPPPAVLNPYSLFRHYPAAPSHTANHAALLQAQNPLLAAQYPPLTPQVALPQTPVSVALPTQANNNNCVLQPYKKMKTT